MTNFPVIDAHLAVPVPRVIRLVSTTALLCSATSTSIFAALLLSAIEFSFEFNLSPCQWRIRFYQYHPRRPGM